MLARFVAESAALLLILVADQRRASRAAVGVFSARDANIRHLLGAVRRADAAADIMEVFVALGVPERAPLFAANALMDLTGTTAISVGFVAVSAIVTEASVSWAVLPADGTDTAVVRLAVRVAKSAILLMVSRAGGHRLTSRATVGLLPARVRHVSVVIVVMVMVDRCTVVILFSMSQGFL